MMNYSKIILSALLLIMATYAIADDGMQEYEETITESYSFNTSEPLIGLHNKYGNIEITTHGESRANLTVKIIVVASNEKRAQEIFNKIDVEMNASANQLDVETVFQNTKNWNWTKKNEKYSIQYYIEIPEGSELDLSNKYGNISCPNIKNNVKLDLKYGSGHIGNIEGTLSGKFGYTDQFKAGSVSGNAELEMEYSEVELVSTKNLKIDSKYTELHIGSAQDVKCHSRNDDLFFGDISTFTNTGKYDDIEIKSSISIDIETQFSNVRIDQLDGEGLFDTRYGQVKIRETGANLSLIQIKAEYTGYDIDIDIPYHLEVDTKSTGVDYPSQLNITNRDKSNNELYLEGTYRNGGNAKVVAKMRHGHLRL